MATNRILRLDISKGSNYNGTLIDMTPYFNGRVGDSRSTVKLQLTDGGTPLDLSDLTVYLKGGTLSIAVDTNGQAIDNADVATSTNLLELYGAVTVISATLGILQFEFMPEIFQTPGIFKGWFGVKDSDSKDVSTMDVFFRIYENHFDMGIDTKPFRTDWQAFLDSLPNDADFESFRTQLSALEDRQTAVTTSVTNAENDIKSAQVIKANANNDLTGIDDVLISKAGNTTYLSELLSHYADGKFTADDFTDGTVSLTSLNSAITALGTDRDTLLSAYNTSNITFKDAAADFALNSPTKLDSTFGIANIPSMHSGHGIIFLNGTFNFANADGMAPYTSYTLGTLDSSKVPLPTSGITITPRVAVDDNGNPLLVYLSSSSGQLSVHSYATKVNPNTNIYVAGVYAY